MNKYGTRYGFPPQKNKPQTYLDDSELLITSSQLHFRKSCRPPRAIKMIVDGLGELKFKTVKDAAAYLGITTVRIYSYIRLEGKTPFPFIRFEYIKKEKKEE